MTAAASISIVSGDEAGDEADETVDDNETPPVVAAVAAVAEEVEDMLMTSMWPIKGSAPKALSSVSMRRRTADDAPVTLLLPLRGDEAADLVLLKPDSEAAVTPITPITPMQSSSASKFSISDESGCGEAVVDRVEETDDISTARCS